MKFWWSRYYARPLKDPLLDTYTLEDLLYEFHSIRHRKDAEEEESKESGAKILDEKIDETLAWAEEDQKRESELAAKAGESPAPINQTVVQGEPAAADIPEEFPPDINVSFGDL